MPNGKELAQKNVDSFLLWQSCQTDEGFTEIIHRGQLNRGEIAKACGFGVSALRQNPALKTALEALESDLRKRKILPPLTDKARSKLDSPKEYDASLNRRLLDSKRLSSLEAENFELKAKVQELENQLARFGELSNTIAEMGFIPR
jgi:hypothetical protein